MQTTIQIPQRAGFPAVSKLINTDIQSDSFLLTVRGRYGRIERLVGEPGIAVAISADKRGACMVLAQDLGECNTGQSCSMAAPHVVAEVCDRTRKLFPYLQTAIMRWFDVTNIAKPIEWEVLSVNEHTFIFNGAVEPSRPNPIRQRRDFRSTPLYDAAITEIGECVKRARRITSLRG